MTTITKNKLLNNVNLNFYDAEGFFDHKEILEFFQVKKKKLTDALGLTSRAVQNPHSESIQNFLKKIIYVHILLEEMLDSEKEIKIWFNTPQIRFGGISPKDYIFENGETDTIIDYLHDIKYDYVEGMNIKQAAENTKKFIKSLPNDLIDADLGSGL